MAKSVSACPAPLAAACNHQPASAAPSEAWKHELANAIRQPRTLLQRLGLERTLAERIIAQPDFRCLVTESYLAKIRPGDPRDPLLRQVLPMRDELAPGGLLDPVGDGDACIHPGLLHKYHGRVLLIGTGACAIHCRYCFRRHYPYPGQSIGGARLQAAIEYLHQHPEIDEVILSGGDPLVLDDERLGELITSLQAVPSLGSLRIHTRLPVVLPTRITARLLDLLEASRLQVCLVLHANHANEIGEAEGMALQALHRRGVVLLNQSVLLRGVNDSLEALQALSRALYRAHTLPYYLHQLDPVQGALHFACEDDRARQLIRGLQARLPGYLVPRLVREIPGKAGKTPLA